MTLKCLCPKNTNILYPESNQSILRCYVNIHAMKKEKLHCSSCGLVCIQQLGGFKYSA